MSDFDDVLERLLGDPGFQRALATNPGAALHGYRLSDEERALLHTQFVAGSGGQGVVETRTSKSGLVGMLAPIAGVVGMATAGEQSIGHAPSQGVESIGSAGQGSESLGAAPAQGGHGAMGHEGIGRAGGGSRNEELGAAVGRAPDGDSTASVGPATSPMDLSDYRPHVDVDGDGHWDRYVASPHAGGGVDVSADMNRDGVADFVGHDRNADGIMDSADYDTDLDGRLDTRMYDDNGDGWMDRSTHLPDH